MVWLMANQLLKGLFQCVYACHEKIHSSIYFVICNTAFNNVKLSIFCSSFTATANETQPFFIVTVKDFYPHTQTWSIFESMQISIFSKHKKPFPVFYSLLFQPCRIKSFAKVKVSTRMNSVRSR